MTMVGHASVCRCSGWMVGNAELEQAGPRNDRIGIKFRHPNTSIAIASIVSGAERFVVTIRNATAPKSIASAVAAASSCMCGSTWA
jgi:hypothetical protein